MPPPRDRLDALPDTALVLDVGGWASCDPRADWVIDIQPFETRGYYEWRLGGAAEESSRVTADTWVQTDICASAPWPFDDDMFDFVICSHTLEDVRDPVRVCEEMSRVAKAGYVETPAAVVELTRGVESRAWCGWHHHRWLVESDGRGLAFFGKPHHIHDPAWPSIRTPRLLHDANAVTSLTWEGELPAREAIVVDHEEVDAYLQRIIAAGSRPDELGGVVRRARAAARSAQQRGRSVARRTLRR